MGWYYPYGAEHRRDLVRQLTAREERRDTAGNVIAVRETLRHCWRGGRFAGTLWAVEQLTSLSTGLTQRWITAYVMQYTAGEHSGWGYKPVEESMGPYTWSCPLGYLDLVPEVGSVSWRQGVRDYHARMRQKRQESTGTRIGTAGRSKTANPVV